MTEVLPERNRERGEQLYGQLERQVVAPLGSGLYDVYTFVIKELKRLIERNAGLLTNTEEHQALFQRSFSWSPIDLTGGERTSKVVMSYLDDLLPQKEITRKADAFVELLCSKKDEWTQLDPPEGKGQAAFDAAAVIREFIQNEFKQVVDETMESFLVKLYSGNKDAKIPQLSPDEDKEGHKCSGRWAVAWTRFCPSVCWTVFSPPDSVPWSSWRRTKSAWTGVSAPNRAALWTGRRWSGAVRS